MKEAIWRKRRNSWVGLVILLAWVLISFVQPCFLLGGTKTSQKNNTRSKKFSSLSCISLWAFSLHLDKSFEVRSSAILSGLLDWGGQGYLAALNFGTYRMCCLLRLGVLCWYWVTFSQAILCPPFSCPSIFLCPSILCPPVCQTITRQRDSFKS